MTQRPWPVVAGALGFLLAVAGCSHGPASAARGSGSATPSRSATPTTAGSMAGNPAISRASFGVHWLDTSHAYPTLPFGSARVWDMGVTWADLQPRATSRLDGSNPVVQRLDYIVRTFTARQVQPLIELGMTPAWAASRCPHGSWPVQTCAPKQTGTHSPWAAYVGFLAHRYHGVSFETWNEPNLKNGWNDTIAKLAALQATANEVIRAAASGDQLVSAAVGVTSGEPLTWLDEFLGTPGGRSFDVFGIHLYPADDAARHGDGPEWSLSMLKEVRAVLARHGVTQPIWDTEANVGRYQFSTAGGCKPHSRTYPCLSRVFTGAAGAAMVARMYLLQLANRVRRVFWYGVDDRSWGGTWMEQPDFRTPTSAGLAERNAYTLLVGTVPDGCLSGSAGAATRYLCMFRRSGGPSVLAVWTTGGSAQLATPGWATRIYDVTGHSQPAAASRVLRLSSVPQYLVGSA